MKRALPLGLFALALLVALGWYLQHAIARDGSGCCAGDLREAISALKAKTERGVLVGAPKLAAAFEELGLIDEYRIVVHPIISGRGPTLFHGLSSARHLELLSTQRFKSGVQALHFRRKAG